MLDRDRNARLGWKGIRITVGCGIEELGACVGPSDMYKIYNDI